MLRRMMMSVTGGAPASPLADKITSWWEMSELTGQRSDSKGSNHLSVFGTVGTAGGTSGSTAAQFGGSGYLRADSVPSLTVPADRTHCLFGWAFVTSNSSFQFIASKSDSYSSSATEYTLSLQGGTLYGQNGGSAYTNAATTPAPAGAWHFYVLWRDPLDGKVRLQVDNGAVITSTNASAPAATSTPMCFGSSNGNFNLVGRMQRWGWIRGGILTPAERSWLYNGGAGRSWADVLAG